MSEDSPGDFGMLLHLSDPGRVDRVVFGRKDLGNHLVVSHDFNSLYGPAFYPYGSMNTRWETSSILRYSSCVAFRPLARNLFSGVRIITIDKNILVIINDVGLDVGFLSHPCTLDPLICRESLMVRSIKRQTISDNTRISPNTSMRAGVFRKRLFTIASSLRNPKLRLPCPEPYTWQEYRTTPYCAQGCSSTGRNTLLHVASVILLFHRARGADPAGNRFAWGLGPRHL